MKKLNILILLVLYAVTSAWGQNQIVGYEYWLNNDYANKKIVSVTPIASHQLSTDIDVSSYPDGVNIFNIRYKDATGKYTSTLSKAFVKVNPPASGVNKIVEYEYWFNNDYANKQTVAVTPATSHQLSTDIDVSAFPDGVNIFNIRYKDDIGKYTSTLSKAFVKVNPPASGVNKIVEYEYWFNNDYANKQTVAVTPATSHQLSTDIDVSAFPDGVNIFNIRYKDDIGKYTSTLSKAFVKMNTPASSENKIVAYEYWFNNDYANKQTVSVTPATSLQLNTDIDVSSLTDGLYVFNFRYKDENGAYSSVITGMFVKHPGILTDNMLVEYRYWFDDAVADAKSISVADSKQMSVFENLDAKHLVKGMHDINYQCKDSQGAWSVVLTQSFEKISLPIANFTFSALPYCDSTVVTFTDASIDGDKYLWDFGDGTTSDSISPIHHYYTDGEFQVSLTVTDTILAIDSTIVQPVVATFLRTSAAITEEACGSYTAPDGAIYTTSGEKTAVIPNAAGCDSTITIALTVHTVDVSVSQNGSTLTAQAIADSYQWLDCNNNNAIMTGETNQSLTATESGNYAVQVSQFDCVDTSTCYAVTIVGITENTFTNNIIVYPNPTNGLVTIDVGEVQKECIVRLSDVNGKVLSQKTYHGTHVCEFMVEAPAGNYVMTITSGTKQASMQLLKK